ncbi:MAG: hypothetical protein ACQESQ_06375 [Bacteroidota bacterium]
MTTLKTFLQKATLRYLLGLILFISFTTFISCEEEISSLGENLIPEDDIIKADTTTFINFSSYVREGDSISSGLRSNYNIGVNFNPYFGRTDGRFASQIIPDKFEFPFENLISLDSLVLYLKVDSICGIENNTIFNIFELDSAIDESKSYYSNYEIENMIPNSTQINTSYENSGDSLLIFKLDPTFFDRLSTDNADTSFYNDRVSFVEKIKGIAIIPENTGDVDGQLFNVNLENRISKVTAYYKEDNEGETDTLEFNYYFNGYKFGQYKLNYEGAEINDNPDSLIYIQGLGGAYSTIIFNDINEWEGFNYSILKAEFILPIVDFEYDNEDFLPQKLFFTYTDEYDNIQYLEDFNGSFFKGTLDDKLNSYTFDISQHFRNLVNGEISDSSIDVRIVNNTSYPHRILLKNNIKLKVTYTKH